MSPQAKNNVDPTSKDSGIQGLLQQIVDILQTSTIAEERGKDGQSKFWAAYKKVSGEFDDNMLERCNSNMDIVLIFAGLFSAVNTTFIIAMQPNPLDTTNALLVQLIQITLQGPSAAQPTALSPSTNYSSSTLWIQALAYMSLALSLLAAFGAVLGKQWLNHYKTHRYGSGSLEERCKQRHSKFNGLETWWFDGVLQLFPELLKASLFLFALSLGAWMWTQQQDFSILIILATSCGFVCYAITIVVSLLDPDCPFQTRLSLAFHDFHPNLQSKKDYIASAMEWMLKTSTNPDVVRAALELMPTMSQKPDLNRQSLLSLCKKVRDMFEACFDGKGNPTLEDGALAYGRALIQFSQNNDDVKDMLRTKSTQIRDFWKPWRLLYLPQALEQCQNSYNRMVEGDAASPLSYQADTRTALGSAVKFTIDGSIWDGKFELGLDLPKVEWLMDCTNRFLTTNDFEAAGDALLLLGGVLKNTSLLGQDNITKYLNTTDDQTDRSQDKWHTRWRHIALHTAYQALNDEHRLPCQEPFSLAVLKAVCPPVDDTDTLENELDREHLQFSDTITLLNSDKWPDNSPLALLPLPEIQRLVLHVLPAPTVDTPERYTDYCRSIIYHMNQPPQRLTALRIAYRIRQDLATILADGVDASLREMVLSNFSPALAAAFPDRLDADGSLYYLRLIFCLANRSSWLHPLDDHIKKCIAIIPEFCDQPPSCLFYLAGFFLRIQVAHREQDAPQLGTITSKQWWDLIRMAWYVASRPHDQSDNDCDVLDDGIEILGALVMGTRMHMPSGASTNELRPLRMWLSSTLKRLESREVQPGESILLEVKGLKDLIRYILDTENISSQT